MSITINHVISGIIVISIGIYDTELNWSFLSGTSFCQVFVSINQDSCFNICIFAGVSSKKQVGEKFEPS